MDDFSRDCLKLVVDMSLSGRRVARELSTLILQKRIPKAIVSDNGTEFSSNAIMIWAQETGINCQYLKPAKPIQNAYIGSFNGKFRDACLNENWYKLEGNQRE